MNIKFTFKKTILLAFSYILLAGFQMINAQTNNVGINTTTPDASAALDIVSTTQGVLVPRMTAAQRGLISSPATGLMVYQSDAPAGFYFYNGTAWTTLNGTNGTNGANGQGVPVGGTANQVLAKVNATDYNTQWVTPATGGADNLGNHTATQNLVMGGNSITGAANITATGTATLGGNTYPTNTGTTGQVLTTDGAGALSWGSSGGSTLILRATANIGQTTSVGSSLTIPDVATCFQNEIADPLNSWNGATGTFTAPSTGMYQIAINTLGNTSAGTYGLPMLDLSPIGTSGEEDFYGLGQAYTTVAQNISKLRGSLNYLVYFTAGQQFTLRIGSGSTVVGFSPLINGSNSITIVKL